MERVSVVGSPGSGKTTFARDLGRILGTSCIELDALHHLPDWQERRTDEFRALVAERIAADRWIVDGNYHSKVQDLVWARADTVVFLDLSRRTVTRRVVARTLRRILTRQELWNGNQETLRSALSRRPEDNIVLWTWTRQPIYQRRYTECATDPAYAGLSWIILRSDREVARFLEAQKASKMRSEGEEQP